MTSMYYLFPVALVPGPGTSTTSSTSSGRHTRRFKYLLTVCTGAGLVARSGILDGKSATTNKARWKTTTALAPKVNWVKTARYVVDGNFWTAGGVSAGIDLTLAWIEHVYGKEEARGAANRMEYEWRDDKDWDPFSYVFGEGE